MKNRIWIFVVGFVLVAAAVVGIAAFFYATSNVDRYRPLLEQNLSRTLGNPVKIGGIQLAWVGGVAAEARDLTVTEDGRTVLSVKRAAIKLDPWALLSHKLVIHSIEIVQPQAAVTRTASGAVQVRGVKPPAGSAVTAPPAQGARAGAPVALPGGWTLLIQSIRIKDAAIAFRDESTRPARATIVRHVDADLKNVSLEGPVAVTARAAVFADAQDVQLSFSMSEFMTGYPKVEKLELRADLGAMDPGQIAQFTPEAAFVIHGVEGGKFAAQVLRPDLTVTVDLKDQKVTGKGDLSGRLDPSAVSRFDLNASNIRIEKFLPPDSNGKTLLEGPIGAKLVGDARGLDANSVLQTANGQLSVDLPQGLLLNMNLVREVLGKLSMFPGLVDNVEARLPQSYKNKLTEQSTILKPFRHDFQVRNGVMFVRDLTVGTDFFSATLNGDLALVGEFDGQGLIRLDNVFSNALFEGAPTLKALANAVSQIEFPLIVRYRNNKLSVLPDLEQIGRRLIPQAGQELLAGFLQSYQKASGK